MKRSQNEHYGHRVQDQDIDVEHDWEGFTPEQICREHPGLTLSQVHAALAYYYDNREAILADIRSDQRTVEQFKIDHLDSVR